MSDNKWQSLLKGALRHRDDLKSFTLTDKEEAFFSSDNKQGKLEFMVNPYYASLIEKEENDPLRRQCIPTADEFDIRTYELTDPLGESLYSPMARLVHRYRDRVLLLVTDRCAMYCRHCFRRSFTSHEAGVVTTEELAAVSVYLDEHREVNEILLSGGDPLTCSDSKIEQILECIRAVRPDMVIRLATRIPAVLPMRITDNLIRIISGNGPIWIVTQFNHSNELSPVAVETISKLVNRGVPILNQSVLLKGVNDSVEALEQLFQALVRLRVKPYYLFQGDLAAGTSHFRVSIDRGRDLMKELRERVSGLALPVYAVDLPGGGGKIPLTENYEFDNDENSYYFTNIEGKEYTYPRETTWKKMN